MQGLKDSITKQQEDINWLKQEPTYSRPTNTYVEQARKSAPQKKQFETTSKDEDPLPEN